MFIFIDLASADMESGEDPLQPSQTETETEKENKSQAAAPPRSSQVQRVCRFYSQGRFCQFGRRCRFLHQRGEANEALKGLENQNGTAAEPDDHADAQAKDPTGKSGSQRGAAPARKERPRRPCRYFLSGYCAMEDRCRFWHPEQFPSLENRPGPRERDPPGPRAPVARPNTIEMAAKLSELTPDVVKRLRDTEICQLLKRIPKDQLIVQEREDGQLTYYRITVQPTDPDWVLTILLSP